MGDTGGEKGLQQGGFSFGPSPFDLGAIMAATGDNRDATANRYNQLGMGGSTPELQDLSQQNLFGEAAQGQVQNAEVGDPATNPALQPAVANNQGQEIGAALGKAAGSAAALGSSA